MKMTKMIGLLTLTLLTACGHDCNSPSSVTTTTVTQTTEIENYTIQSIVSQQNAYRASIGQEPLVQGLSCTLYTVPTSTTGIAGASLTNVGSFTYSGQFNVANSSVSTGLPILPTALENTYETFIVVKCYGSLIVTDNNYHQFDVDSDDGSNLYIDGQLVVANDGLHAATDKAGIKFLQYGVHSFELDFFQGQGMQELIVNEDGQLLNNEALYH